MNLNDISTQILYTTAPIWCEQSDGTQTFGTGFILSLPAPGDEKQQIPLLVTNAHVVKNASRGLIELPERSGDKPKIGARLRIEVDGSMLTRHIADQDDLALLPIGGLLNQLEKENRPVFFRSVTPGLIPTAEAMDEFAALEEITFIGYPSGLYDEHNVSPIIRQGITATPLWNNFQGEPAFLVDAGVFPGSSGSPVFIMSQGAYTHKGGLTIGNRLFFLGVLTEAIQRTEPNMPPVFLGIGKVIKSARVQEFAERTVATLQR